MDELEKYISNNIHSKDEEPAEGHFQRFEQKLKTHQRGQRRSLVQRSMRIASVALLLVMSALYIGERFFSEDELYINPELQEAQFYYKTQISQGISTLETIDGVISEEQRALLLQEMTEADELLKELQEELTLAPDDPRLIDAMLHHYRLKAAVLNHIVNDLQQIQTSTNNKHYETQL